MRSVFPSFLGNDRIKQTLSGNLSHAYIIEGIPGSGRLTAARNASAAALCLNRENERHPLPCGGCSVCSRIFRGIHPDVIEFSSDQKKSIGVNTARELRSQVFISPVESEYKFFIIRDADLMTPEAQNALLLSIEEPPSYSIFFLLVTDRSQLLETIRSRCVTLTTDRLDTALIEKALKSVADGEKAAKSDPEKFRNIIQFSNGSLGAAFQMISAGTDNSDEARSQADELVRVILTGSPVDKVRLSVKFPRTKDEADRIYTIALHAVRDIISCKLKTDAPLLFYRDVSEAVPLTQSPLARLMALSASLDEARIAISGNASALLTAERVIMQKL